jgi:hypothetical protein
VNASSVSPGPSGASGELGASGPQRDRRLIVVAAVPVVAVVVGLLALPHPRGVEAAQQSFDRSSLGAALSTTATTAQRPVDVTLGGVVQVRGADLPQAALSRGARLSAKVHFGVVAPVVDDWQIFVHVDADEGGFRVNGDHWPARGKYRTTLWQVGEFVVDAFDVVVPTSAPAGTYTVWVGLYHGDERLPFSGGDRSATDGDNRVKVGTVVVE